MKERLVQYKTDMQQELQDLLAYWQKYTIDEIHGGFVGGIDINNQAHPVAPKGVVLNARILWSFAAAYNYSKKQAYLTVADRAYHYLADHFTDQENGGVYWSVDYTGQPLDTKKQVYALSFVVYALSEYYRCNADENVKEQAIQLYRLIVQHAYDKNYGGFIEALTADWKPIEDFRLSAKDDNTPKSMNSLLHVLEAFTNLYRIWPDETLKDHIKKLLGNFEEYVFNKETGHLNLFFDHDWTVKSGDISFGHDIEAAWLLLEAAEVIKEECWIKKTASLAVLIATTTAKALDSDGGLWYESGANYRHRVYEKHWWPQAEAMIGFLNAYQLTGDENFIIASIGCWQFVKAKLKDPAGEWYWGINKDGSLMNKDKAGFWKCPYHNSRACLEIIKRVEALLK